MREIAIRQNLTDEWKERGNKEQRDFSILTAEISKEEEPDSFEENKGVAKRGGKVTVNARKEAEARITKTHNKSLYWIFALLCCVKTSEFKH